MVTRIGTPGQAKNVWLSARLRTLTMALIALSSVTLVAGCQSGTAVGLPSPPPGEAEAELEPTVSRSGNDHPSAETIDAAVELARDRVVIPEPPCSFVPGVCRVAIQPLGDVGDDEITAVKTALESFYGVQTVVLEGIEHPQTAWYPRRRRWRAELLVDHLETRLPAGCQLILGVGEDDISTTKGEHEDWGILGLATIGGPAAVISAFRTRRRVDEVPAIERLQRVALHEIGHAMGLRHCQTYGCYLEDAGGTVETIDRETFLCDRCKRLLDWI